MDFCRLPETLLGLQPSPDFSIRFLSKLPTIHCNKEEKQSFIKIMQNDHLIKIFFKICRSEIVMNPGMIQKYVKSFSIDAIKYCIASSVLLLNVFTDECQIKAVQYDAK